MVNKRLRYVPQLANEPEYIQSAIVQAWEEILKRYDNHWLLATVRTDGYYILVMELGMPKTMPCSVFSVVPQAGLGKPEVKEVFSRE